MTTVLVVVNKKRIEQFKQSYLTMLLNHNQADFENWQNRTRMNLNSNNASDNKEEQA